MSSELFLGLVCIVIVAHIILIIVNVVKSIKERKVSTGLLLLLLVAAVFIFMIITITGQTLSIIGLA